MMWRAMRLGKGFTLSVLLAVAVPGVLALTAITTLADSSPAPAGSPALPGDPAAGGTVYAANCTSCHGVSLEGGIGPTLNPIDTTINGKKSLGTASLIDIITNGHKPRTGDPKPPDMPAKENNPALPATDVQNLAAYIIQQN